MKRILFSLMLFACLCSAAEVNPLNAVVRVDAMGNIPSFLVPWQSSATSWSGSAVVIEGRRILTNAHNVAWATFITLTKQNDDTPYEAKVQHVSHDNDLALLTVEDERFFDDIVPMALGPTPPPQSSVLVAGYPVGGTSMSLTRGIVSRIEMTFYKQSSKLQLGTQLDAAINSGNSGGPVLFDGKVVGIAFQGLNSSKADGIGYMIPYEVIDQFFKDIKDNRIDGIGTLGFDCAVLVNAGARHYLGMDERQTGVVVWNVDPGTDGSLVKKNDVVLSANGHRITNVGNIMLPDGSLRHWLSIVTLGQIGDVVHLELLRDGKVVKSDVPIRKFHIVVRVYEHMPSYVLFNGMVFTVLSDNLFDDYGKDVPVELSKHFHEEQPRPDDEIIVLTQILADASTNGYQTSYGWVLTAVNGKKMHNLRELSSYIDSCQDKFMVFSFEDKNDILVETEVARKAHDRILRNYDIPADRRLF